MNLNEKESYSFEEIKHLIVALREAQLKTDEQLKELAQESKKTEELFKELAQESKKTDELFKELAQESKKTDEQFKKTDEQFKKTDEQFKKTDERFRQLAKEVGGIGQNNGAYAEEFFWNALKNIKNFEGIKIDYAEFNVKPPKKQNVQDEFDILLWNGNSVIIVEVKYKVQLDLIEELKTKKINNFKILIPDKADLKIYCGIASFCISEEIAEKAKEEGLFVLRQSGENLLIEKGEVQSF